MAIRIRCQGCRKKISIDQGFAGGFCRCPYCKAITKVPARDMAGAGMARRFRPERPTVPGGARPFRPVRPPAPPAAAPERPEGPAAAQARAEAPAPPPEPPGAEEPEQVPVADPVRIQGLVALVLLGLLVLLVGGSVFAYFYLAPPADGGPVAGAPGPRLPPEGERRQEAPGTRPAALDDGQPPPRPRNLFEMGPMHVAGMKVTPPVVYVVDGSSGMRECHDLAAAVVRHSVRSLGQASFKLMLAAEKRVVVLEENWLTGGEDADARAQKFFLNHQPSGATVLTDAMKRALAAGGKTVVVLAAKAIPDVPSLMEQAHTTGTTVLTIGLGADEAASRSLAELAKLTGGESRSFQPGELLEQLNEAPPLP